MAGRVVLAADTSNATTSTGNYQSAKLIQQIEPAYRVAAKLSRVEGTVQLPAVIDSNGKLTEIQVMKGSAVFLFLFLPSLE